MDKRAFSIIGCQHEHIGIFIEEMLGLGYECVGIYEKENKALLASVANKYNLPIVEDKETLLDQRVAIVGSSAINNQKIDIIELCAERGKHIMVDKPAVTNRQDYKRLQAIINQTNIEVGMLLTERYQPALRTLKRYLENGELGQIVNIGIRKPHKLRPSTRPEWHFSKEQCGGLVIDLFVHDFDLLRWLTGVEVVDLDGIISKNILPEYPSFYDTASVQVLLKGNILAQLYADWHTPEASETYGDGRVFVVGTKGYAELRLSGDPLITNENLMFLVTHENQAKRVELDIVKEKITEDFLRRIKGEQIGITHQDILAATKATIEADERVKKYTAFEVPILEREL
ncbi:Gfo/Idh/MocA family protein [Lederbergia galactosidilytica]|uniref:Oxidoreductase n=1 Tax=Lederbergia galactosidilytica TaxID=217031 RepID=A0A177ZJE2_9BACI|nr:Gfo/Idh/MocA family oxidoreductase [Lederbergia galactosidilytica]KRG15151.1 oxidoreductase [Virgibacillus soli]MBP1913205.1 putative dehydrogenase [Lederbergia galactosidilytica]OAK67884.1 oxidoreductase [Lederbergia galactosidilytica]